MKYIDTHTHYALGEFNEGREALLQNLHENGLEWTISAAINGESNLTMSEKLSDYPWIYYSAGLHPTRVGLDDSLDKSWMGLIKRALKENKRVIAIGEAGLDYHRLPTREHKLWQRDVIKKRQEMWFRTSLDLAHEYDLPLILHIRDAHEDAIRILAEYTFKRKLPGVVHCFHGSYELAKIYMDMGFKLGIGGAITYEEDVEFREAMKKLPLSALVLETDAPYVSPVGYKEVPNTSATIPEFIATEIARLKEISVEEVIESCNQNAREVFGVNNEEKRSHY